MRNRTSCGDRVHLRVFLERSRRPEARVYEGVHGLIGSGMSCCVIGSRENVVGPCKINTWDFLVPPPAKIRYFNEMFLAHFLKRKTCIWVPCGEKVLCSTPVVVNGKYSLDLRQSIATWQSRDIGH